MVFLAAVNNPLSAMNGTSSTSVSLGRLSDGYERTCDVHVSSNSEACNIMEFVRNCVNARRILPAIQLFKQATPVTAAQLFCPTAPRISRCSSISCRQHDV